MLGFTLDEAWEEHLPFDDQQMPVDTGFVCKLVANLPSSLRSLEFDIAAGGYVEVVNEDFDVAANFKALDWARVADRMAHMELLAVVVISLHSAYGLEEVRPWPRRLRQYIRRVFRAQFPASRCAYPCCRMVLASLMLAC